MRKKRSKYWGKPFAAPKHPYVEFENTAAWRVLKRSLADLEENQDLSLNEWHQYVVGYVCKSLAAKGIIRPEALMKPSRRKAAV